MEGLRIHSFNNLRAKRMLGFICFLFTTNRLRNKTAMQLVYTLYTGPFPSGPKGLQPICMCGNLVQI